jgi:hypothetical protein
VHVHEVPVDRGQAATSIGAVHHVVVYESERVEELEGSTGVDRERIVRRAARAHEGPVTERRSQSLSAGQHEIAEGRQRGFELRIDCLPALELGVEKRHDACFGAATHVRQAGRHAGGATRGRGHPVMVEVSARGAGTLRPVSRGLSIPARSARSGNIG